MLQHLRKVAGADLSKLLTLETSSEYLSPSDVKGSPQLCFIDGEHTRAAAFRDGRFCRQVMRDTGAIVFHDRRIVARGIVDFLADLDREAVHFVAYPLPSELFVVELGQTRLLTAPIVIARRSRYVTSVWKWAAGRRDPARAARAFLMGETAVRRHAHDAKRAYMALRRTLPFRRDASGPAGET